MVCLFEVLAEVAEPSLLGLPSCNSDGIVFLTAELTEEIKSKSCLLKQPSEAQLLAFRVGGEWTDMARRYMSCRCFCVDMSSLLLLLGYFISYSCLAANLNYS